MLEDFNNFQGTSSFHCDLCIVGAGPAGITLARQLVDSGLNILLLESGGADYEQGIQDLAAGESTGFPYYDLADSRLRLFGGTTAIWGGRCARLDSVDFIKRSWIPYSGWPFDKYVLYPYYRMAQKLLDLLLMDDNIVQDFQSPAS